MLLIPRPLFQYKGLKESACKNRQGWVGDTLQNVNSICTVSLLFRTKKIRNPWFQSSLGSFYFSEVISSSIFH